MGRPARKYVTTLAIDAETKGMLREMARRDTVSESAITRQAIKAFFFARNISQTNAKCEVA